VGRKVLWRRGMRLNASFCSIPQVYLSGYQPTPYSSKGKLSFPPRLKYRMPCRISHYPIHSTIILRQYQIQKHANNSRNNKRRLNNQIQSLFKALKMNIRSRIIQDLGEPRWLNDIDEPDAERSSEDEAIATRPGDEAENADTGYGDCGVQEYLHAT
jgi:hypothetical protein